MKGLVLLALCMMTLQVHAMEKSIKAGALITLREVYKQGFSFCSEFSLRYGLMELYSEALKTAPTTIQKLLPKQMEYEALNLAVKLYMENLTKLQSNQCKQAQDKRDNAKSCGDF